MYTLGDMYPDSGLLSTKEKVMLEPEETSRVNVESVTDISPKKTKGIIGAVIVAVILIFLFQAGGGI